MSERELLYQQLPDRFSPLEARELAGELNEGKPWLQGDSWIRSVIDAWLFDKKISRVKKGVYRKNLKPTADLDEKSF